MRGPLLAVVLGVVGVACFTDSGPEATSGGTAGSCPEGSEGCPCADGECIGALACDASSNLCTDPDCPPGGFGCVCGVGASCDAPWACVDGTCRDAAGDGTTSGGSTTTSTDGSSDGGTTSTSTGDTADDGTTGAAEHVHLYYGWVPPNGDLSARYGGSDLRENLDDRCADAARTYAPVADCSRAAAVISLTAGDTIANLWRTSGVPFDVPVVGPTELPIADSFEAVLETGMIDQTLEEADVYVNDGAPFTNRWWSGSQADGTFADNTCMGWASDAGSNVFGAVGVGTGAGTGWIAFGNQPCAADTPAILCACW